MDCLFCAIAAKNISAKMVYEDGNAIAFLDITPRSTGHTLVIPKKHAPTLLELEDREVAGLFIAVKKVDGILQAKLSPDGVTIGINQGKASGQEVGHLHVHLIPRWHGDGGGAVQSVVARPPEKPLEEVLKQLTG